MGARSSIVVRFENGQKLHLYTHNGGRDVPGVLERGLARLLDGGRADDEAWVASVLLDELRRASPDWPGDWLVSVQPTMVDPEYGEWRVDPARATVEHVETRTERSFQEVARGALSLVLSG